MAKALRMLCSLPRAWVGFALLVSNATLSAATFTVTNTTDADIGSLRLAILDANLSPGPDLIAFDIPGEGVHTIAPTSPLPPISEAVTIDGYTQPGSSPNTQLASDDAVLLIEIDGSASGDDADGLSVWHPDGHLVYNVTIRGLVVNRFDTNVLLTGGGQRLEGCFIGTDPSGTLSRSREGFSEGVYAAGSSTIGGALPSQRNVISGNNSAGIRGSGAVIQGNFIGIDATGTASLANLVAVGDFSGVIGGPTGQAGTPPGNVISGNQGSGITFTAWRNRTLTIQGNLIGTDPTGAAAIPNGGHGVSISRNLFWCEPPMRDCSTPGYAIVGGDDPAEGNVIAYNLGDGIAISGSPESLVRTDFRSNRIHSNAGLAIDRHNDGVTPNTDGGPRNYPILTAAVSAGGSTLIQGILNGEPNVAGITIAFASNAACDPALHGEGETPIGSATVDTDADGYVSFSAVLPVSLGPGMAVAAMASKDWATSEFSACQIVDAVEDPSLRVLDVAPQSGAAAGGTRVTVLGANFSPGASVTIGGVSAENVVVVDLFRITATTPMLPPGTLNDVSVAGALDSAALSAGWMADFLDVTDEDIFHDDVEAILRNGITAGCGDGYYCRNSPVRRDQMAVFLLKGLRGSDYEPPPCTPPGRFLDVACPGPFTDWVEQLATEGITSGCGDNVYCPGNPVRRDQMAAFLLKAEHGSGYIPPACTAIFSDVPCPSLFADWIERLAAEAITGGCGGSNYCPQNPATRGQMAVFVVKTFNLQ